MRRLKTLGLLAAVALCGAGGSAEEPTRHNWRSKYAEYARRGFTTGTIEEFLEDARQRGLGYLVLARTPRGIVFSSPIRNPGRGFVLFQVKSVQGRELLLGPQHVGDFPKEGGRAHERYLEFWTLRQPTVAFDETKHAAGIYFDQLHQAAMFVVRENAADGRPLEALYYPRRVAAPNLVDAKSNEALKAKGLVKNAVPAILHSMKERLEALR